MSVQSQHEVLLLARIDANKRQVNPVILHYDPNARDLRPWFWPLYQTGELVPPSKLASYRVSHEFRPPSCLCIVPSGNAVGAQYSESAIYLAVTGEYWREYVAGCPTGTCAYLIELERLYSKGGLLTKHYPLRAPPQHYPISCANQVSDSAMDLLLKLDSRVQPGIPSADLTKLLRKCPRCEMVMTRRVTRQHRCLIPVIQTPVIDLTEEAEASCEASCSAVVVDLST